MKIGYFTERPYQDPRIMGVTLTDLDLSNDIYDASLSADLFDRYIDEKIYAEEVGFDMIMLNEHHSTATCMSAACVIGLSVLARITKRARPSDPGNSACVMPHPARSTAQTASRPPAM